MERRNSFRRSIYTAVDEDETRNNSLLHYKSKTHIINGKHPRPPPNPTPFIVGNCGIPNAFMKNDDRRFFDWNCSSAVFFSLLLAEKSGIGVLLFDTWTKKKKMSGSTTRDPYTRQGFTVMPWRIGRPPWIRLQKPSGSPGVVNISVATGSLERRMVQLCLPRRVNKYTEVCIYKPLAHCYLYAAKMKNTDRPESRE